MTWHLFDTAFGVALNLGLGAFAALGAALVWGMRRGL